MSAVTLGFNRAGRSNSTGIWVSALNGGPDSRSKLYAARTEGLCNFWMGHAGEDMEICTTKSKRISHSARNERRRL
jgi:hypothetical protein